MPRFLTVKRSMVVECVSYLLAHIYLARPSSGRGDILMVKSLYPIRDIRDVLAQIVGRERGLLKLMSSGGGRWFSPKS